MTSLMERIRVTFDVSDAVKRAIAIYAAEQNLTVGQVIERMAAEHIPDHIAQAERAIESGEKRESRRGRPPKPPAAR